MDATAPMLSTAMTEAVLVSRLRHSSVSYYYYYYYFFLNQGNHRWLKNYDSKLQHLLGILWAVVINKTIVQQNRIKTLHHEGAHILSSIIIFLFGHGSKDPES